MSDEKSDGNGHPPSSPSRGPCTNRRTRHRHADCRGGTRLGVCRSSSPVGAGGTARNGGDGEVVLTASPQIGAQFEVGRAFGLRHRAGLGPGHDLGWVQCVLAVGAVVDPVGEMAPGLTPAPAGGDRRQWIGPGIGAFRSARRRAQLRYGLQHVLGNSVHPPGQPGSGGRTMMPCSSIHTTFGMLTTPKRASSRWLGSSRDGCSGSAASMYDRDASGPLSSREIVTTSSPLWWSSWCSACHPGRSKAQPQ